MLDELSRELIYVRHNDIMTKNEKHFHNIIVFHEYIFMIIHLNCLYTMLYSIYYVVNFHVH